MVSFKLLFSAATALLASSASAAPPTYAKNANVPKNFTIDAAVIGSTGSAPIFGGRFLEPFHTGAGTNAVVAMPSQKHAALFYLHNTHLINSEGTPSFPAGIMLSKSAPYNSTAPKGYKQVNINAGLGTAGFSIPNVKQPIKFHPPKSVSNWDAFAICKVNQIAYDPSAGPQYQLLWRPKGVKAVYGDKCGDVVFYVEGK